VVTEPVRGAVPEAGFYALSGLEQGRAFLRRLVPPPPIAHLVGCRLTQLGAGTATYTMPASPWLQGGHGHLEYAVLMDSALTAAVGSTTPPATAVRLTALSVNRMRPVTLESETLVARARTLTGGPNLTFAEVVVEDALGRLVAHGTTAAHVRAMEPPPPPSPVLHEPVALPGYPTPDPYLRPLPAGVGPLPRDALEHHDALALGRMIVSGELPAIPVLALFGGRLVEVDAGSVVMSAPASGWFCGLYPEVSPGVLASLAMHTLTAAAFTVCPAGGRVGVVHQDVDFLRPVAPDGRDLLILGRGTYHRGDHVLSEVEITDGDGAAVAAGHAGVLLLEPATDQRTPPRRELLTVLFTDLVGSTEKAAALGDDRWRALLGEHDRMVRRQIEIHKGQEIKMTGDGVLATFDSPGRAVRCAAGIRDGLKGLGLDVRAGIHAGECELVGADVSGIAVNVAARVMAVAGPGEILVSSTVCDLVAGSGISFAEAGLHELKGVEGKRQLFAVRD
jgi:uncharacterized protein (TIGR00369 family)